MKLFFFFSICFFLNSCSFKGYDKGSSGELQVREQCGCFDGIGSSSNDEPILVFNLNEMKSISVCGYKEEGISDQNSIFASEFNIFDCPSGNSLVEYSAIELCRLEKAESEFRIFLVKYLPSGKNWKLNYEDIGIQKIKIVNNDIEVDDIKPYFKKSSIDSVLVNNFFSELDQMKGEGNKLVNDVEVIISKLEYLSLNENVKAMSILSNFESFFNIELDGALSEALSNAIATTSWIRSSNSPTE